MGANEHLLFWLGIEAEGKDEGWALAIKERLRAYKGRAGERQKPEGGTASPCHSPRS